MLKYTEKIRKKIVESNMSIIQTMKMMDQERTKTLIVFKNGHFLGIITNGDLQRAIIANMPFDYPIDKIIDNNSKKYSHNNDDREKIKEWMIEKRAELMPLLDDDGNLKDVIFWEDIVENSRKVNIKKINIPVVIMAGGKGTRLKPLTNVLPKPLIPIGDKTIIEEILNQFENIGCEKFYMSVNYKSEIVRFYMDKLDHKYNIDYFEETKPLGTIGSVSLLDGKIKGPFFVTNCDIIINQDYRDVYDYHINNKNEITIIAAIKNIKIPYGVVEAGKQGLLIDLKEKPELTYMVNSGVYILNSSCIKDIPQGEFFHITDLMEKIKNRKGRIGCYPVSEDSWRDMGEWAEYLRMIKVL